MKNELAAIKRLTNIQSEVSSHYLIKKNGDIVMMVIDGRQVDSRGAYLKELAMLMIQFDCEEALNLDGGGSSSIIVNG